MERGVAVSTIAFLNGEVLKAEERGRRLQRNVDLLCAGIADDSLSRPALQQIARMIAAPSMMLTPTVIEWATKVVSRVGPHDD